MAYVSVQTAADLLSCSQTSVLRLFQDGSIAGFRMGRTTRVSREDVESLLVDEPTPTSGEPPELACAACDHIHEWHQDCLAPGSEVVAHAEGAARACGCRVGIGRARRGISLARPAIPAAIKRQVIARDGERCTFCGVPVHRGSLAKKDPRKALHLDHIVPYSQGGATTVENLRVYCGSCNSRRGAGRQVLR